MLENQCSKNASKFNEEQKYKHLLQFRAADCIHLQKLLLLSVGYFTTANFQSPSQPEWMCGFEADIYKFLRFIIVLHECERFCVVFKRITCVFCHVTSELSGNGTFYFGCTISNRNCPENKKINCNTRKERKSVTKIERARMCLKVLCES